MNEGLYLALSGEEQRASYSEMSPPKKRSKIITDFFSKSVVKREPKVPSESGVDLVPETQDEVAGDQQEVLIIESDNEDTAESASVHPVPRDNEVEASTTLYQELVAMSFPCPVSVDEAQKMKLCETEPVNHNRPLIERRSTQSDVRLTITKVKPYLDWLVIGNEGAVCKACKIFLPDHLIPRKHGKFLSKPWTTYSRIQDVKDHAEHEYHAEAMSKMMGFVAKMKGVTIPIIRHVNKQIRDDYDKKKRRLYAVVKALVYCARAGVALRGHRNECLPLCESGDRMTIKGDVNRGNFIATLGLMRDSGDTNVDIFINKKTLYTSHAMQDELLEAVSSQLTRKIVTRINHSKFYTIIADETRDNSNTEVLCVAIRFFDYDTSQPDERFLSFLPLDSLRGAALATAILKVLEESSIPLDNCVGQSYDGASNMSGKTSGTAAHILAKNPRASYSHCRSHKLNLSLVKSCTTVQSINNMMGTLTEVCSFFSMSPKRQLKLTAVIKANDSSATVTKMVKLSQTRWVERYKALETGVTLLPHLVEVLNQMTESEEYRSDWNQASSLLRSITSFQFVYALYVCHQVMDSTKKLTRQLQGRNMTVANAGSAIAGTRSQIGTFRLAVETYSQLWYKEVVDLAESIGTSPSVPRRCGRQTHRDNLPSSSTEEYYLRTILIPFLDILSSEFDVRFGTSVGMYPALNLLPSAVVSAIWKSKPEEWRESVVRSLEGFIEDLPCPLSLRTELTTWRLYWQSHQRAQLSSTATDEDSDVDDGQEPETYATDSISEAYKMADELCLVNVAAALRILACLPVTSCEAERAFSRLALLKTDLRSTMTHKRLNHLAVISMHRDLDIDVEEVASRFLAVRD